MCNLGIIFRDTLMTFNHAGSRSPGDQDATIEALARETDMPIAIVKEVYVTQHTQLEKNARVKMYLPILISSKVKHILNQRKAIGRKTQQTATA